ncbi:RrF2 family transcriptional regulator [Deinococcus yavapaiensis]|uniref:BadM/Rrf2 family transcriptional regulator n=1 Tax=Deinococcus yavapaiensis KR-236 TaxID=694435 RepID=A0A318SHG9_9DEIO|nr:Rrf2 family transcriptional regulator [Deinococcus yavapaiensis]PYE56585.1 BadM/Rrf2 family transcriptional regulator [Deinococcus yavapaiensis KR-236]
MDDLRNMLKREESLAIHALINIAENPGTNAAAIAKDLQAPPAFLAKILSTLVKADLVTSTMGRGGGVKLAVDPDTLTLLDVVEAVSGKVILDGCQVKAKCPTQERKGNCKLKAAWIAMTLGWRDTLGGIRLAQLCDTAPA